MICGSPQTDEEQQEKTRRRRKRRVRAEGGEERKGGKGEASSYVHRLLYTYPLPSRRFSFSRFLPFSLIDTFLPSFSLHLLPFSLIPRVTLPPCHLPIAHPHATRERESRALGPWRNQFKWLSVDVIDFHFTRLSRGRRSSTRCAVSIPTPAALPRAVAAYPASARLSLPHSFPLFLRRFASSASHASLSLPPSAIYFCFPFSRASRTRVRRIRAQHRAHKYAL